jgi:hypothetical protein
MAWAQALHVATAFISRINSLHVPVKMRSNTQTAKKFTLLNTRATENFISKKTLAQLGIGTQKLPEPRRVCNADGSNNCIGAISHYTDL